jgi:hypothetical protein
MNWNALGATNGVSAGLLEVGSMHCFRLRQPDKGNYWVVWAA